jgi:hypothetical protein
MNSNKTINWKDMGMLEGLTPEHSEIVKSFFNKVDVNKLEDNEDAETIIWPVLRHILVQIIDAKNVKRPESYLMNDCLTNPEYFHRGVTVEKLLNEINVDEISEHLLKYCKFLPLVEDYLPNIDAHAEMTLLFCRNYLMKILDKVLNDANCHNKKTI